jgi:hypothetical protein
MGAIPAQVLGRGFMTKEKDAMRQRLAALSFTEKVKILEKFRDRSLTLAASGLRQPATANTHDKNLRGGDSE